MEEISFSVFNHGPAATENMRGLLREFEQRDGIHVRLEIIPWETAWARLVEIALYHTGPDVSQVGSTWVGDLVRMGALRSFTDKDVEKLQGPNTFFDSVWVRGFSDEPDEHAVYSIPWTGDARVVYYRRDLLYRAGIDERTAFRDAAQFQRTIARLHEKGRVFYTSLGHREDVWTSDIMKQITVGGFAWVLGEVDFDPVPNIAQVTPGANQLKR